MQTHMGDGAADTRLTTALLGLFAAHGTMLAVIGVYGVVAYLVTQRTAELGVRVALGAARGDIFWLVLRSGVSIGLGGVGLGVAGAVAARRLLSRTIYGTTTLDPVLTIAVAVLLFVVIVVAGAIPARRALRVDPVTALRNE